MVFLTVLEIVVLIAGLAFFLFWLGSLLTRIAENLEAAEESVRQIRGHAGDIVPGVEHINRTGKVVASALPLLYGFAERIVAGASTTPTRGPARPASGTRRSRLHETVGYRSR
ncbi:hypothetical protein [Actinophytocola oryzae]|uniref:DUF948 domain-containing protein n=1 Tax=Actinophytocola oryzae TaxID=502181 RepID=A0A4R7VR60_9PSEU|nr:hypothetical protein [Actinophytocola oryzae]TDV52142.1 hypothetical protein CLV71_105273 [Actinophytocola oryzae]